jgi:hypothetical protein
MGSEGRLDDQLASYVSFQQAELLELSEALCLAHRLIGDVEGLVADNQLNCSIAPLNQLRVANHLFRRKRENVNSPSV